MTTTSQPDPDDVVPDTLFPCPCMSCVVSAANFANGVLTSARDRMHEVESAGPVVQARAGCLMAALQLVVARRNNLAQSKEELRATWLRLADEAFEHSIDAQLAARDRHVAGECGGEANGDNAYSNSTTRH